MTGYRRKALILVFLMIIFSFSISFAQDASLKDLGIKLKALGLLLGDPDGNMRFEDNISRAEFTTVAVRLIGKETEALSRKGPTKFKDIPTSHWSTGHINIAVENGLIHGYKDSTFGLKKNITYGEVLTILVNALGYADEVSLEESWPENFILKANALGITKGLTFDHNTPASRGAIAKMLDNSLSIILKHQ